MRPTALALIAACSTSLSLAAENSTPMPASAPAGARARVVVLTLSPAPEPTPALRYSLLPGYMDQVPGNAVQHMYMAAQAVGELSKDDPKDKLYGQLIDWLEMPLGRRPAAEVDKALARSRDALHYARLAALRDHSCWDIPTRTEGFAALLPHLRPYRTLSRLLVLRAGQALAANRFDDALADLQTTLALSRWTAGPTLIHNLVAAANAQAASEGIEAWVGQAGSPNLYWAIVNLPEPLLQTREAYEFERFAVVSQFPSLARLDRDMLTQAEADQLVEDLVAIRKLYDQSASSAPAGSWESRTAARDYLNAHAAAARKALLDRGCTRERVEEMSATQVVLLQRFKTFEEQRDALIRLLSLPYWQSAGPVREWERQLDEIKKGKPDETFPFLDLIPKLDNAHFSLHRVERSLAALRVIEAIRMHMAVSGKGLPAGLQEVRVVPLPIDPITGKSFMYERTTGGARLILPAPDPSAPQNEARYELRTR